MKQTSGFISTYSADTFGVCSALYELGGMVVMHDASGCNSTYTTHDEPRWYDMDSMVYISALTEIEAIMGDDSKLIEDIVAAALELNPRFIAIAGTPIPAMTGFDAEAAARVIEERTGIPSFGFATTGMKSYVHGANLAFEMLAERFVEAPNKNKSEREQSINILGLTPLDFSVNRSDKSIKAFYEGKGYRVISTWAMGASLEDISHSAEAGLNIVVSETGIGAARRLEEKFRIPYKIGIPIGGEDIDVTAEYLNLESVQNTGTTSDFKASKAYEYMENSRDAAEILIMGEKIASLSLAKYLESKIGRKCMGYATTDADEDEIIETISSLQKLEVIIADPLFKPALKLLDKERATRIRFVPLPHEAFSGRLYRADIPNLIMDCDSFIERQQLVH